MPPVHPSLSAPPSGRLPLTGVRVLELTHIVAGPSGGALLADLGADVIKVEEPRIGDQSRAMANQGSTFYALNRNKRSVALDLKTEAGQEIFARLVKTADVVLDNYAPGVLERLGIGYEWGAALNPGIVYCSVKGFLPGPYGERPLLVRWPFPVLSTRQPGDSSKRRAFRRLICRAPHFPRGSWRCQISACSRSPSW